MILRYYCVSGHAGKPKVILTTTWGYGTGTFLDGQLTATPGRVENLGALFSRLGAYF